MSRKSTNFKILQSYVKYLNELFNQTITHSRLTILQRNSRLYITRYQDDFLPLELKPHGYLHFRQLASVQSGRVVVGECRYIYSLSPNPDDEQQWVFRYDYSLAPRDNVPHAHYHLNANKDKQQLRHIHFPTGRLSIEQIIHHLIIEHGVKYRMSECLEYLAESHREFMKLRTDPPLFP